MHFGKGVRCFLMAFLTALLTRGHLVAAGPGGYVTLINGSPYDWKLTFSHEHQMDWKPAPIISTGTSIEQYFEYWYDWGDNGDCGAEATYELVGSPVPASFQLQARQSGGKRIQVQFKDALSSLNNPQNSIINLGYAHDGSVAFILSGDGTQSYISSNPPIGWMQATLSTIGSKTLREIAMPDSHDAGMSEITRSYGGIAHNTQTQSGNIYQQLINGARWFDIRPVHRYGEWYTGHFSTVKVFGAVGGMGRMIPDIIADINKFTTQNPGELIILDLSHEMDCASSWIDHLSPEKWQQLYQTLGGIHDLWAVDPSSLPNDYSSVPVSTFIQPGSESAVLIRIPDNALLPTNKTLPLSAFVQFSHLPFDGSFSDTNNATYLTTDQISKLHSLRTLSQSQMQRSTWTITPSVPAMLDIANWWNSIIGQATYAHRMLYAKLWPEMSKSTYPNLIEVDDVHSSHIAALCMAINDHFASDGILIQGEEAKPTDMVVTIMPTPTSTLDLSESMTAPLPTVTPPVLRIKGRTVERKG
jgi:hypothetical protein